MDLEEMASFPALLCIPSIIDKRDNFSTVDRQLALAYLLFVI